MPLILLSTLNARYIHSAMGLRCLQANMGVLESETGLLEFTINQPALDIVGQILAQKPEIIGFGIYIWNVTETTQVVGMLKQVAPGMTVVLGGPEVSHEWADQEIVKMADYVITGQGDLAFAELCRDIVRGQAPKDKIIKAENPELGELVMPYRHYTDEDVKNRIVYVEASRGCPFKCEFCLSALEKNARPFDLGLFLSEMASLHDRGVRHFKFIDRTFNLRIDTSCKILDFFLARLDGETFLHFEVVPDKLPEPLRERLVKFPPGILQLEIGIQTFNPEVQSTISRRQDNEKSRENLAWIRQNTHAHIHADLIAGLPGETLESLGESFNQLVALNPQEIQMGILKRLRGSVITRHTAAYGMVYSPFPPYALLQNNLLDFATMQRVVRFARYWDLIGNSGRFAVTRPLLLGDQAFARFMQFSDWLHATTDQTHQFALKRLFKLLRQGMLEALRMDAAQVDAVLLADWERQFPGQPFAGEDAVAATGPVQPARKAKRQAQHVG